MLFTRKESMVYEDGQTPPSLAGDSCDAEKEAHAEETSQFELLNGNLCTRFLTAPSDTRKAYLRSVAQEVQAFFPIGPAEFGDGCREGTRDRVPSRQQLNGANPP